MALEKMVSDLSNFKTKGDVAYDKLDPQIKEGVDYFPDNTSGAKGFTPSTDLLTKYNKFMKDVRQNNTLPNQYDGQANILAPNAGLRINDNKTRSAYGSEGEYLEPAGVGVSKTNHILSSDTVLGVRIQPKFTSEFMTTPIADFVSKFQIPYDSDVYDVQQHISSGPTQFNIQPFDNTPSVPNAHGGNFMTTPIADYNSRFSLSTPLGAGSKTLGVLRVIHTADNSLATQNANYNSVKNEGPFSGVSDFSVQTTKRLYNDSSYIKDLFEFKDNNFTNVPSGLTDADVFSTDNFRSVANRNVKNASGIHPIILRKPGSNWDDYLNEKGIISEGGFFEGTLGLLGLLTRTSRDLADKQRIGTYLLSEPGKLFIAKQVAFQALNPTLESKIYNPLSAVGIAGASDLLNGDIGGILRAAGSFLFPTHVERHLGGTRYENILKDTTDDNGRLFYQSKAFRSVNIPEPKSLTINTGVGFLDTIANNAVNRVIEDAFFEAEAAAISLPFSLSNPNKYGFLISSAPKSVVDGRPSFVGGPELAVKDVIKALNSGGTFDPDTSDGDIIPGGKGNNLIERHSTLSYENLKAPNSYGINLMSPSEMNDKNFRKNARTSVSLRNLAVRVTGASGKDEPGEAINERFKSFKNTEDIGDVKSFHKVELNKKLGNIKGNMLSSNVDKVNITPYGASVNKEKINVNDSITTKDFIKFRFKDVINNKFLIFRAILEGITDTVTPEYAEDRYIGRPDKLFVYQGVDRSISFTFSIYPKTKQELPILMEKLNYLIGLCYPSYTEGERMISPFIELTMGDMFVETPGILSGLTVTVEEQSTWELDEGLQFPHFIKAACEFRHIGNYIPATKGKHYDLNWIEGDGAAGFSETVQSAPNINVYTDKSELGFPKYPERDATWRKNVFEQLGQGKVGAEQ